MCCYKRQNIEATIRKGTLTLCTSLTSNWEKKEFIELCTSEAQRGSVWWKIGAWRLKGIRRNNKQEICPICSEKKTGATY